MGFFSNLFGARKQPDTASDLLGRLLYVQPSELRAAVTSLDIFKELYGSYESASGVRVTHEQALEASTALACARVISDGLSQVPFRLMRKTSDGKRSVAKNLPLWDLLENAPNSEQSGAEMRDEIGLHLVFAGNAYVFLLRNSRGEIIELLPLEPSWVTVTMDRNTWTKTFNVAIPDGKSMTLTRNDLWHLRGPSWNGWMGLDGVKLAREALGLAVSQEKVASSSMKNGTRLQGFLTSDQPLNKEQRDSLRASWQENYGGAANSGRVGVLSNGMKFVQMSQTMTDAQFLEQRKFQVEEICRIFRVMPIMVGYSDKTSTHASAEQMFLSHVVHTMGPWYSRIEASANVSLLTAAQRAGGYYTKFFDQALLRGASKDRAEFYTKLYNIGAISPNEIRDLEDMDPYDGGDRFAVPLNMISPKLADQQQQGQQPAHIPQPMAGEPQPQGQNA